jgi:hypothetical protein
MNLRDKQLFLETKHFKEWLEMRRIVENEFSEKNGLICFCGRLATGLHEMGCKKFQKKTSRETIRRLEHLIPKSSKDKNHD